MLFVYSDFKVDRTFCRKGDRCFLTRNRDGWIKGDRTFCRKGDRTF